MLSRLECPSGGGATVSDEHGVATGKQYPGDTPQSQTPQGSATGAPSQGMAPTPAGTSIHRRIP